jgi:hypothetical protein
MFEYTAGVCVICREEFSRHATQDAWTTLSEKGIATVLQYSVMRHDLELQEFLQGKPSVVNVHVCCRKKYTNKRTFEQQSRHDDVAEVVQPKSLRSHVCFDWKQACFFCGELIINDDRHPERCETRSAQTLTIRDNLLAVCRKRNDQWAVEVEGRLNMCVDLVATEAIYHVSCHRSFCQTRTTVSTVDCQDQHEPRMPGRPDDQDMCNVFEKMCDRLEDADDQLYTVSDLQQMLREMTDCEEAVYSLRHIRRKLEYKYGEHIFFAHVNGKKNVICFRDMASRIINEKWYTDRKESVQGESERIIILAAKLVKAQIRETMYNRNEYPTVDTYNDLDTAGTGCQVC